MGEHGVKQVLVFAAECGDDLAERQTYVTRECIDLIEPETIAKITQPEYRRREKEYQECCAGWESRISVRTEWRAEQASARHAACLL